MSGRCLSYAEASGYLAKLNVTNDRLVSRELEPGSDLFDLLVDRPQLDVDPFTRRIVLDELGAEALVGLWRVRRSGVLHQIWRRWWYVVVHVSSPFGHCRSWVTTSRNEAELRYDTLATRVCPHLRDLPFFGAPVVGGEV